MVSHFHWRRNTHIHFGTSKHFEHRAQTLQKKTASETIDVDGKFKNGKVIQWAIESKIGEHKMTETPETQSTKVLHK